jgi:hypothetical protein
VVGVRKTNYLAPPDPWTAKSSGRALLFERARHATVLRQYANVLAAGSGSKRNRPAANRAVYCQEVLQLGETIEGRETKAPSIK